MFAIKNKEEIWLNTMTNVPIPTANLKKASAQPSIKTVQSKGQTFKIFANNPSYIDWWPTSNQSGEVIKMQYTHIHGNTNSISKIYRSGRLLKLTIILYYSEFICHFRYRLCIYNSYTVCNHAREKQKSCILIECSCVFVFCTPDFLAKFYGRFWLGSFVAFENIKMFRDKNWLKLNLYAYNTIAFGFSLFLVVFGTFGTSLFNNLNYTTQKKFCITPFYFFVF